MVSIAERSARTHRPATAYAAMLTCRTYLTWSTGQSEVPLASLSKLRILMNSTKPIFRFTEKTQHYEPRQIDAGRITAICEEDPKVHA